MALTTVTDALPDTVPTGASSAGARSAGAPPRRARSAGAPTPGLSARMTSVAEALGSVVADLDPGVLLGADAASLYATFARIERLVVAGKTLLAPRIAESGHWETEGHRSPAALLAALEGVSAGQARRTLETGQRLGSLPSTEAALRTGTLSGPKVSEIAQAATVEPEAEGSLLAGSDHEPLHVVRERCQRVRATSAAKDPRATLAAIHAARSFTSWTDPEGAFCFQGRDTPEQGARLLARLTPVANRLRSARRAAARDGADTGRDTAAAPEPEVALRADALFLLLTGTTGTGTTTTGTDTTTTTGTDTTNGTGTGTDTGPGGASGATSLGPVVEPVLAGPDDLVTAGPTATVIVRVDLAALRRGRARPGECCELDGLGPVPVPVAQSLADDSFLCLVFTEAGDIKAVSHRGRTINQHLRTGLAFRDRCCVVPGCGVAYGLEIDHVVPLEHGGATCLDNLALLCHHHHRMKTYDGWILARTGPSDEDPGWTFVPQPPFGQEPGLGIDRPPEAVPRT